MTPRQWLVLALAVTACVFAVIAFLIIADKDAVTKVAGLWLAGGIFVGGVGLGITAAP